MPSWVPVAVSVRCAGWSDTTWVSADVEETVVRDSFVLSAFGWLVMVL
jgi:hypothetical protein